MTKPNPPTANTPPEGAAGAGKPPAEQQQPEAEPGQRRTPFARFFSSVEGRLVSRYGSGGGPLAPTLIGATRNAADLSPRGSEPTDVGRGEGGVTWNTDQVVAITEAEAQKYSREYDRAVKDGALIERTEADYVAAVAKARGLAKETLEKAAAEAKAKAEAEAKAKTGRKPEGS